MCVLLAKTVCMETTVSLRMNNMAGVVQKAGTAKLSEAPEFTQFL
jgi:hypothetical protein